MRSGSPTVAGSPRAQASAPRLFRIVAAAFSFETAFVLFIFAGIYKADPRFAWVPVDLTALFGLLSIASGAWLALTGRIVLYRRSVALVVTYFLLVGYATFSLLWTPSSEYGPRKVLLLALLVSWALVGAAIIVGPDRRRLHRLFIVLRAFAVWVALEAILAFGGVGRGSAIEALGGNYLGVARVIAIGAILFIASWVQGEGSSKGRLSGLAIGGLLLGLMLAIGGRGPLLAVLVALALPVVSGLRMTRTRGWVISGGAAGLLVCLFAFVGLLGVLLLTEQQSIATVRRLLILISEGGGESAGRRVQYFGWAMEQWASHPIRGNGIGSWPLLAMQLDIRAYPHNLVLEVLAELGLVGVGLVSVLVAIAVGGLRAEDEGMGATGARLAVTMLVVNAAANAMISGDLGDNRFFFLALGLAAGARTTRAEADETPHTLQAGLL